MEPGRVLYKRSKAPSSLKEPNKQRKTDVWCTARCIQPHPIRCLVIMDREWFIDSKQKFFVSRQTTSENSVTFTRTGETRSGVGRRTNVRVFRKCSRTAVLSAGGITCFFKLQCVFGGFRRLVGTLVGQIWSLAGCCTRDQARHTRKVNVGLTVYRTITSIHVVQSPQMTPRRNISFQHTTSEDNMRFTGTG